MLRSSMRLAWIEPDKKARLRQVQRTFERLRCQHLDTVTVKLR